MVWLNLEELSQQPNLDTSLLVVALVHEAGGGSSGVRQFRRMDKRFADVI